MKFFMKPKKIMLIIIAIVIVFVFVIIKYHSRFIDYLDYKADYKVYEELCMVLNANNIKTIDVNEAGSIYRVIVDEQAFRDLSFYKNDNYNNCPTNSNDYLYSLIVDFRNGQSLILSIRNIDGVVEVAYKGRYFLCKSPSMWDKEGIHIVYNE